MESIHSRIKTLIYEAEDDLSDGYRYYGGTHAVKQLADKLVLLFVEYQQKAREETNDSPTAD
jgi:hypothetical protein